MLPPDFGTSQALVDCPCGKQDEIPGSQRPIALYSLSVFQLRLQKHDLVLTILFTQVKLAFSRSLSSVYTTWNLANFCLYLL